MEREVLVYTDQGTHLGPGRSCYFTRKSRAIAGEHENSGVRQARLGARGHIRDIFLGITKKIDGVLN